MNVRTYRAPTMPEALAQVREELGIDAIILSAREVPGARRFPWRRGRAAEVVAGIAEQTEPLRNTTEQWSRIHSHTAQSDRETAAETSPVSEASSDAELQTTRLNTVESLLADLEVGRRRPQRAEVPDDLFHLFARLIDADVDEQDARELIVELQASAGGSSTDASRATERLVALIEDNVRCSGPIPVVRGQRTTVALVGPTGVGKTTTIAKLAANFKLRDGYNVGLVTVDTYRVAAVEQLRTYAEIIDLPMQVVSNPSDMRLAIDEMQDLDLVLIDTAGRSPRDELKIQELRSILAEADVDHIHLVLSLVASVSSLAMTAERFGSLGPTDLVLTKLDEAPGLGTILSAARRIALPISYLTTGQDVPDDIEPAQAAKAARMVLGLDPGRPLAR